MVKKISTHRAQGASGARRATEPPAGEARSRAAAQQRSHADPSLAARRRQMALLLTDVVEMRSLHHGSSPRGMSLDGAGGGRVAGTSLDRMPSSVFDYLAEHLSAEDMEALATARPVTKGSVEPYRRAAQCARDYARARSLALYRAANGSGAHLRRDPRFGGVPPQAAAKAASLPTANQPSSEPAHTPAIDVLAQLEAGMG